MPMWCPPTPPQEENDLFIDQSMCFLYETQSMTDIQLPPVYVKKELKRARVMDNGTLDGRRPMKLHRKDDCTLTAPRSIFDHPMTLKMRRDAKLLKRGTPVPPVTPSEDKSPEWTISEDWALLHSVEKLQELPLSLQANPGHLPNWDLVADMVNVVSRIYRSPLQCKNRYESVIVPREEGKLVLENKKPKKTKTLYKSPNNKSNRPMRTAQLLAADKNAAFTDVFHHKFDNVKTLSLKRKPTVKPLLVNPTLKNPKHAAVLAESGISYETPANPVDIASRRADRISKEKQKIQALQGTTAGNQTLTNEQQLAQQILQQRQQAAAKTTAPTTQSPVIPFVTTSQAIQSTTNTTTVVNASTSTTALTQSSTVTTQVSVTQGMSPVLRPARPVVGIQEMVARSVSTTPTTVVSVANLTSAQLQAARLASGTLVSGVATVSTTQVSAVKGTIPVPVATKTINAAQIHYRQQHLIRLQQQQQQRLTLRDPQLKVIQTQPTTSGQKITQVQPVVTQQQKTQFVSQATVAKRPEEMSALMKQHLARTQQKTATVAVSQSPLAAQFLAQAGLQVQTGATAALVKTSGTNVTIPMAGIAIPQVKTTLNPSLKPIPSASTTPAQIRQLGISNYQQLLSKGARVAGTKVTTIGKGPQLIVQSQSGKAVPTIGLQHIQQVMKNVTPQHLTVSAGQPVLTQGSQVVLAKSPHLTPTGTIQTRVLPVSSAARQIQVVPGTVVRSQGGQSVTVTTGTLKQQQAFISQVTASLPGIVRQGTVAPVRIQTSSASGAPLMAVTVQQQANLQQLRNNANSTPTQDNPPSQT